MARPECRSGRIQRASGVRFSRFPSLAGDQGESQLQSPDARSTQSIRHQLQPFRKESTVGNPSKDLLETEGALRTIIETLIDNQEGFWKIGEALEDETLKRYFLDESLKRAEFRGELENILHQEGVKDIQEAAGRRALSSACLRAEDRARRRRRSSAQYRGRSRTRGNSGLRGRAGKIPSRPGSRSPAPAGRPR